jgi:hypothetical protein
MLTAVYPAVSAFALLGVVCFVSWPLCRTRRPESTLENR